MWNSFALAVQTLTRLPALMETLPTRADARRAVFLFPLVGAFLGVLVAAVWTLGVRVWTGQPLVAAALALAAGALLSGRARSGRHRPRGGWPGCTRAGRRPNAVVAVMRDARRGTTGLVALGIGLALRLAFLAALPMSVAWAALVLTGVLGGWATAFAFSAFPVASTSEGGTGGLADAGPNEFLAATVIAILCAALVPTRGPLTLLAVALVAGLTAQAVNRTLGGLNQPLCAALGEIAEIVALVCLSIR